MSRNRHAPELALSAGMGTLPRRIWQGLGRVVESMRRMLTMREENLFLLLAVIIGIYAGLAVVCFRITIEETRLGLLGSALYPAKMRVVLVPALVGLLTAFLLHRFFPRARGSGVNQTKSALYIYDGYIPFNTVIGKFVTCSLAIGGGHSLGPEDPSLQMGAGFASWLGRSLRLSRGKMRLIAPIGAAAGLGAAFNSPITAVLFVIEEVIGKWSAGVLGAIVLSAVSGTAVARWFLGDAPLFRVPAYSLVHPGELIAYAVVGVVGGLSSLLFVKLVTYARVKLKSLPRWSLYVQSAGAGLAIGFVGIWFPQVMGAGYEFMDQAMNGQFAWRVLLILGLLKILTTSASFASGTPGGMFAPTLFIGAMIGAGVGSIQHTLFPELSGPIGAYALVGMGTLFAGFLRAPMTSVFMILEVSGNYSIILPVMISNTIAYLISRRFQPTPIFDVLSRQDGLDLPSMEEIREQPTARVEDAMRAWQVPLLSPADDVAEALERVEGHAEDFLLIRYESGAWSGIAKEKLRQLAAEGKTDVLLGNVVSAQHLPVMHPDQPLDLAMRLIKEWPFLPVVHRANYRRLVGIISLPDILEAYRAATETGHSSAPPDA